MALPLGGVVELTLKGKLLDQAIMNVFHYQVDTVSTAPTVEDEMSDFILDVQSGGPTTLLDTYLACMPSNYVLNEITAQAISPIRYVRVTEVVNLVGLRTTASSSNVQAAVTFRTSLSGRKFVGKKFLPLPASDIVNGMVGAVQKGLIQSFADRWLQNVVPALSGGIYAPVIWHRNSPATPPTRIRSGFPQDTQRVIRRRTVGLGI